MVFVGDRLYVMAARDSSAEHYVKAVMTKVR